MSYLIVGRDKLGDISEHEDFLCVWVSLSLTCGQETTHAIGACISTDDLSPATCHMYNMCHSSLFSWLIGRHIYTYKHAYMYRACMILLDNYKKGSGRHARRRNCSVPHASIYPLSKIHLYHYSKHKSTSTWFIYIRRQLIDEQERMKTITSLQL